MVDQLKYDVLIIGGGPSGVSAALTLAQNNPNLSVGIIEGNCSPKRVIESLSPHANVLLQRLGIWDAFLLEKFPPVYGSAAAWGSDKVYENEFIYQKEGHGWHLNRNVFDSFLRKQCIAKGIHLLNNHLYQTHSRNKSDWTINVYGEDADKEIKAKFVIDATGRRADFAKREGVSKRHIDHLIGIYASFTPKNSALLNNNYTLVETASSGWWYSAESTDNTLVTAWMSDADLVKKSNMRSIEPYLSELSNTSHIKSQINNYDLKGKLIMYPASSFQLAKAGGHGWVAAGDAYSTYDPLSSSGILKALRSGMLCAFVGLDFFNGEGQDGLLKYSNMSINEYKDYLKTRHEFYFEEKRWVNSSFWKRRHDDAYSDFETSLA